MLSVIYMFQRFIGHLLSIDVGPWHELSSCRPAQEQHSGILYQKRALALQLAYITHLPYLALHRTSRSLTHSMNYLQVVDLIHYSVLLQKLFIDHRFNIFIQKQRRCTYSVLQFFYTIQTSHELVRQINTASKDTILVGMAGRYSRFLFLVLTVNPWFSFYFLLFVRR